MSPRQAYNAISDKTNLSMGTAVTLLTLLIAGGLGYTRLREEIVENRERTMETRRQMDKLAESIDKLSDSLIRSNAKGPR